ncbi:MAG: alpha/beta hydrolase [Baekduia sp.]
MEERYCELGDVCLCFEEFGADRGGEPLLLIMGLGAPMIAWPVGFCEQLVEAGFDVIRFDNRDVGRSTVLHHAGVPRRRDTLAGRKVAARYSLSEMARDAVGLLDHMGFKKAHVVGASMGGMIAQVLAIEHPDRVLSLTSIMSTTGRKTVGRPHPGALRMMAKEPPTGMGIEAEIDHFVQFFRSVGSKGSLFEEDVIRALAEEALTRGSTRAGTMRQLAAITTTPDRTRALRRLKVPSLVIHGTADRLVHVSGGRATARALPGSTYLEFADMGHDLPSALWPQMVAAISSLARSAPAPSGPARPEIEDVIPPGPAQVVS